MFKNPATKAAALLGFRTPSWLSWTTVPHSSLSRNEGVRGSSPRVGFLMRKRASGGEDFRDDELRFANATLDSGTEVEAGEAVSRPWRQKCAALS